ncbi:unnamed protein product [Closterium sp. Yama58-4]|nr:unnamed protein product [Closterium sp. Yama58-4]
MQCIANCNTSLDLVHSVLHCLSHVPQRTISHRPPVFGSIRQSAMAALVHLLESLQARPDDVFCFVETPLLATTLPYSSYFDPDSGYKPKVELHVCILFNASGSMVLPPTVVRRRNGARPYRHGLREGDHVHLRQTKSGELSVEFFSEYIGNFNGDRLAHNKTALLLVSGRFHRSLDASSKEAVVSGFPVQELSNTLIVNIGGVVDPVNFPWFNSVLEMFKTIFRSIYLSFVTTDAEWRAKGLIPLILYDNLLVWVGRAWRHTPPWAVHLTWARSGVMPLAWRELLHLTEYPPTAVTREPLIKQLVQLQVLIDRFARAMSSGKRADNVTEGVKLVHYDSDGMHAKDATIIDGVRKTLFMIHEAQLPTDDPVKAAAKIREAEHIVIPKEGIPQQSNDKDCGVFVCMYMKYLVRSDFTTVRTWVSCDTVTAKDFRRGMRANVCSLVTGELMMQLLLEEIDVPLQPIPVVGDQGVLMFPNDDDVRLELARMLRERTNLELGGFVLASAVTSIAKALGYDVPELRAACAHELSTCGTPLLRRSSAAENLAERQGAQDTLADMLHERPEPLRPVPAIWARRQQEDTGATLKARKDSIETPGPHTPDTSPDKGGGVGLRKPRSAAAKSTASAVSGEKKRGGTSEYTGVWFETRREEDAAYAYAAGAFVIRRKDTFPKVMELTAGEMAALEGCIEDDMRHLVHKR